MPGIFGFVGKFNKDRGKKLLENMAEALHPDGDFHTDMYYDQNIGLGRISLGFSNPEPQPIWNEDNTVCAVMEGEIFDSQEKRRQLIEKGYRFRIDNDVEYVLHLYEELGDKFAIELNGSFLIAIWDTNTQQLIIVNDRFGLHPVYYAQHHGKLIFASGVRGLLADTSFTASMDSLAVAQFLAFEYVLGDRTFVNEIKLLDPASLLIFHNKDYSIQNYWSLDFQDTAHIDNEDEIIESFGYYMRQAVARQSRCDQQSPAVLLSGGLDSRFILAYLADVMDANPHSNRSLFTFTFGIPHCDDARYAQDVARVLGTKHNFFELKPDYLLNSGDEAVALTDGMFSCIHMHAFANIKDQANLAKIIYKGYLGDALLGGHLDIQLWSAPDEKILTQTIFEKTCTLFRPEEQTLLFAPRYQKEIRYRLFDSFKYVFSESKSDLAANRQNHFDLRQRQRRFILNGVELVRKEAVVRTPFCDNDLVEFVLQLPPGLRYNRSLVINTLVRSFPELAKIPVTPTGLPLMECVRDLRARTSRLFRWHLQSLGLDSLVPNPSNKSNDYNRWMRTSLRGWIEELLLSKRTVERDYFNPDYIRSLVSDHFAGKNNSRKLGAMISLELWQRRFID